MRATSVISKHAPSMWCPNDRLLGNVVGAKGREVIGLSPEVFAFRSGPIPNLD